MNRGEIIAMATEAGLNSYRIAPSEAVAVWERFAALVAAKEREACAKLCDEQFEKATTAAGAFRADMCAEAIRARGTKEGA